MKFQHLADAGVAGSAALAGAGAIANFVDSPKAKGQDSIDDGLFGDAEAATKKLARAGVAATVI